MMRTIWMVGLAGVLLCGAARPARAIIGTIDDVPAATLLLPYFEVDPTATATSGLSTEITYSNTWAGALLTHVTLWSDAGVPVYAFNLYMTGYDHITFDLRDMLVNGTLPQTASAGQDPSNAISPRGPISQDVNFASCNDQLPPPPLDAATLSHLQKSLSGQASPTDGQCYGFNVGDGHYRGYITIDTVNNCTTRFPGASGYFGNGGSGDATLQNNLSGEWHMTDRTLKRSFGSRLVAIEGSGSDPQTAAFPQYTFYGRVDGFTAHDNREPLGAIFHAQYRNGGLPGFPAATRLIVWRDAKRPQTPFTCGSNPAWHPLGQEEIVAFDQKSSVTTLTSYRPFARATQIVTLGSAELPVPFSQGFLYLNLNTAVAGAESSPLEDPNAAQSWVEVIEEERDTGNYGVRGRSAIGKPATCLSNASSTTHALINP